LGHEASPEPRTAVPDVSVVIANWNGERLLPGCLSSIEGSADGLFMETIVVDNASTDGSVSLVRSRFPGARVVEMGCNAGFAAASNAGMRLARGRFVCLVNSDVIVGRGCFPLLVKAMLCAPEIGIIGPRVLNADGSLQDLNRSFPTLGRLLLDVLPLRLARRAPVRGRRARDVDIVSGCFLLARRDALDRVGLLDERFFFYGEDVDLCRRFHDAGWRVCCLPRARAVHLGGATSRLQPLRFTLQLIEAKRQYWDKHVGRHSRLLADAIAILHHGVRLCGHSAASLFARRPGRSHRARRERSRAVIASLVKRRVQR
jgi:GT2 family glycosyltransferase